MASRRDELNAYTFAKRRLIAQFLQPNTTGSEEGAPKPLRAVVPGAIIGVVILAGFGAWGMFKPVAPKGWDKPRENVIIASKSTTRYVVVETGKKKQLHPVLNMASAKLLLNLDRGKVIKVDESVLDSGKIPHGATLGIPYAPDRLPKAKDAGSAKRWAVCERPGQGGRAIQKAAFVLADREKDSVDGERRLTGGQLLYVESGKDRYIVDAAGTAYPVDDDEALLRQLVGQNRQPQRVSPQWLATLHKGDRITFPEVPGTPGEGAGVPGGLERGANRVGMILKATDGTEEQHYVVLEGRIAPITDFMAKLLLNSSDRKLIGLGQNGRATQVSAGAFQPGKAFGDDRKWPGESPAAVNTPALGEGSRNTVCSVLREVAEDGRTTLSTWAGTDFPAELPTGSASAYVTPGSGLLFRQFQGSATEAGALFLVTDTGLRYAMQSNSDSATDDSGIGTTETEKKEQETQTQLAQRQLGYKDVTPVPVPVAWSAFLPTGPRLSTGAANEPQGS
ncbi:type VII secretion protein EccB [Streptomyces qinzhouensis]|uniref:Type VII secretion protein EccB n=1 Tax=Streptomyces qinzhouensis TaxID=2599401 RepID=A0A5B8JGB4_9ACTN|nr:type VII secretion protein EccB [Streptomyces qinzhouensis]QDY79324.1 type VII secretion protein EccB [Streptomyces qinzhouensis]